MIEAGGEEVTSRGYVAHKRESQAQVNLDTKLFTNSTQHTCVRAHRDRSLGWILRDGIFKKLLESECFCFPGLLMGVFCVGEKHHNSDTLLKYFSG